MPEKIFSALAAFGENPAAALALIGVLAFILFLARVRKIEWTTGMLVNISLMLAVAAVLSQLRLYHMPQGGSVTAGSMLPILFVVWRYGLSVGMLAGFMLGIINLIQDPFFLHPVQVLFDYPLPFMAMGLAALWKNNFYLGALTAFFGRFICHFISGVVFFGAYAPAGTSAVMWSLTFNATYMIGETIVCLALIKVLPVERLLAAMDRKFSRGEGEAS